MRICEKCPLSVLTRSPYLSGSVLEKIYQLFVGTTPEGGGTPHMKVVGMLIVSLRGVNFGFWSHLGCSGQNAIIFSREGLV